MKQEPDTTEFDVEAWKSQVRDRYARGSSPSPSTTPVRTLAAFLTGPAIGALPGLFFSGGAWHVLAVAYLGTFAIGLPVHVLLARHRRSLRRYYLLLALLCGIPGTILYHRWKNHELFADPVMAGEAGAGMFLSIPFGLLTALLIAGTVWIIAFSDSEGSDRVEGG